MTACIRGCRIRGQHTADCATECAGCLPRPATEGLLCEWDYARLVADVESLPSLIAHLDEMSEPGAGRQGVEGSRLEVRRESERGNGAGALVARHCARRRTLVRDERREGSARGDAQGRHARAAMGCHALRVAGGAA